jgi:2-hydroxychromene-2-carboxylate isomerase
MKFYFDFVSPYSYLAWTQIHSLADAYGRSVEPVPVLFAALLAANGTKGPAEVPARRRYMLRDLARIARAFDVAFDLPPAHPFNPLLALRLASVPMAPEQHRALVDALFRACWVERRALDDAATVAAIAAAHGTGAALAGAATDAVKQRLRAETDAAIAQGIFGVPTIVVDGETVWGCDSLPHLRRFLAGEAPPPAEVLARWEATPAAAIRKPL